MAARTPSLKATQRLLSPGRTTGMMTTAGRLRLPSQPPAPGPAAPPQSWQEHWTGHTHLLALHSADGHSATYADADVDRRQASWMPGFINRGWQYTKATYGDGFGPDPRLYLVLHAGRYPGGRIGTYRDPRYDCRNTVDLGPGPWHQASESARDAPLHGLARLVEFAGHGTQGSPAYHLWGDRGWADIFIYDLYHALGLSSDAERCHRHFAERHVSDSPRPGTWWYRDWFYPLWRDGGGAGVLARYFSLLASHFPGGEGNRYLRDLTWGEYLHFTSGAAGSDVRALAARAFGWHPSWDGQLDRARQEFPAITY